MRRTVWVALALVGVLVLILAIRTFRLRSYQVPPATEKIDLGIDSLAVQHLAAAVRFATVAPTSPREQQPFLDFQAYLAATYPRVFASLEPTFIAGRGLHVETQPPTRDLALLLKWKGSDSTLKPVLLLAHQDVVPVEAGTDGSWEAPPFSGRIAGGYLWGRGSMDDKGSLVTILEAVESLLNAGFNPQRTIYIAFGDDEETWGSGAEAIAAHLGKEIRYEQPVASRRLAFVLDEGMAVTQGYLPGFRSPVALIGIAEKGNAIVELTATAEGGHTSMPRRMTATDALARAVIALDTHLMPAKLDGPTRRMLEFLAPESSLPMRIVFANLWLFGPIVRAQLSRKPATDATLRTTTAVVKMETGVKENVVPSQARALVNFRIRPGDTASDVLLHVKRLVDREQVTVKLDPSSRSASPISDPESPSFNVVAAAIRQVFPDAVVAPALVLGGTDSRHFVGIADAVYRFVPLRFQPGDDARIHGTNERVSVENVTEMVRFYRALIQAASRPF